MTQYGFVFNGQRCTGCKACVMACKDCKDLTCDVAYRQVYEYGGGEWMQAEDGTWCNDVFTYYVSAACMHCANPACVAACPTGAMMKDEETGLVCSDPEVCIGCGACAMACPYGAPVVDEQCQKSVKCDGCIARVAAGQKPVCVEACPLRALDFGPIDEMQAMYGDCAGIAPLADPSMTMPSIVIVPADAAKPCGDETGCILNPSELVR